MNERDLKMALLGAKGEALAARIVLDELRAGRLANALELLEQALDTAVLAIDSFSQKLGPAERKLAAATLRVLRDYRQRHPRKSEAAIEGIDETDLHRTQMRVLKILNETK